MLALNLFARTHTHTISHDRQCPLSSSSLPLPPFPNLQPIPAPSPQQPRGRKHKHTFIFLETGMIATVMFSFSLRNSAVLYYARVWSSSADVVIWEFREED